MKQELEQFLVYLQETKKMSDNTRISYKRDLDKLIQYLADKGITEPKEVTATQLELYILYLEQQNFAPASISRMVASIKAFSKYLLKKGMVKEDCAELLKAPKVVKKKKEQLSTDDLFRLLEQPSKETNKGIRDRAMMELLYATGIRVSDLISLEIDDVNLKLGCVNCRNKVLSFGRETQVALAKYLSGSRESFVKGEDSRLLFLNCSGGLMSRQGFWKLMKSYAKEAGIQTDITSNMIRKM